MAKERPKSPRLRLFVALDLPEQVLDRMVAWQAEAFADRRDLRLVPKYSLHLTLAFLGYQAERDVERIAEVSFAERGDPFDLRPSELVEVPPRRPRLYALGLEDRGKRLGPWQTALAERLEGSSFYEPEKRPFWPHLTVARFKRTERHGVGRRAAGAGGRPGPGHGDSATPLPDDLPEELVQPFQAGRLTLYSSTLKPQGAVYEALARVELEPEKRAK